MAHSLEIYIFGAMVLVDGRNQAPHSNHHHPLPDGSRVMWLNTFIFFILFSKNRVTDDCVYDTPKLVGLCIDE
jgi:hypothetical protein